MSAGIDVCLKHRCVAISGKSAGLCTKLTVSVLRQIDAAKHVINAHAGFVNINEGGFNILTQVS
jgi:hypothetical protein